MCNEDQYHFGYNGKTKDNEWAGVGNHYNYGMRCYDPRISRFPSIDPLTSQFPMLSPYQYASLNPIKFIDLDGCEGADIKYESSWGVNFIGGSGMSRDDKQIYSDAINRIVMPVATGIIADFAIGELIGGGVSYYRSYKMQSAVNATTQIVTKTEGAALQVTTKMPTITQNAKNGAEFEKQMVEDLVLSGKKVETQITVKTASGVKTRLDAVVEEEAGSTSLYDAKSSETATLTKNQKKAYPAIEQTGATVVGKGKGNYKGGKVIPPTKVNIVKPNK